MTEFDTRRQQRAEFLAAAGWRDANALALAGDASTRSYERLTHNGRRAILMNAPVKAETAPCPPDASPAQRAALGYNALARLAGPNLNAFIDIAGMLVGAGFSAPQVFAADIGRGFALIEDLGDDLFARAIPAGADEVELYAAAVDALVALRRARLEPPASAAYFMLEYDAVALAAETALLTEWYVPFRNGEPTDPAAATAFARAWQSVLSLLPAPSTVVLRDFHAENLIWLPARHGVARVGMIDFQDGLVGHSAYDLVSLLEDARRDVTPSLAMAMVDRYCANAETISGFDAKAFREEYAILGAQRNAKILGIFARLVKRDGKPRYEGLLPRVETHFRNDLRHPALAPVARVIAEIAPDLKPSGSAT
ncbi:MAG: phosphotransferase [Alphaproteobacteria bacterium]|nr:phosphotransferase [Alphaproteobacteria bacterium]